MSDSGLRPWEIAAMGAAAGAQVDGQVHGDAEFGVDRPLQGAGATISSPVW
jgi:hypothetical protein